MDINKHTKPDQLEKYAFLWSIARMLIASIALFLGGLPPVLYLFGSSSSIINSFLSFSYYITGATVLYLLYRWNKGGQKLFQKQNQNDKIAFLVMIITGINLGLVGLIKTNIGMMITMNHFIFILTGIIYLTAAGFLMKRWNESGKKLF